MWVCGVTLRKRKLGRMIPWTSYGWWNRCIKQKIAAKKKIEIYNVYEGKRIVASHIVKESREGLRLKGADKMQSKGVWMSHRYLTTGKILLYVLYGKQKDRRVNEKNVVWEKIKFN